MSNFQVLVTIYELSNNLWFNLFLLTSFIAALIFLFMAYYYSNLRG